MKANIDKIVELSHKMIPGKENFKLEVSIFDVEEFTDEVHRAAHRDDVWYVSGDVHFSSHMGTHIEFPFHHWKTGSDCSTFPLSKLIGEAVVVNCTGKKAGDCITLEEVKKYDQQIQAGDMVFLRTDFDKKFREPDWEPYPYLANDALLWLLEEKKISIIGSDATCMEVPGTDYQPNHTDCMKREVAIIESLTNLGEIEGERAAIIILPLPIQGLESCPVRILGIKKGGLIS